MRVLIIDDDWGAASGLRTLLEMDGFDAHAVPSSALGLDRIANDEFDALVTDLEMPGYHGLELIRAARAAHPEMPILVVTAYIDSTATRDAVAAGAQRVFGKPLHYELLLAELKSLEEDLA